MRVAGLQNYSNNIAMTGYTFNPAGRKLYLNPMKYQIDKLLNKGLIISHRRFLGVPESIAPYFKEVMLLGKSDSSYAFDISRNGGDGKYLLILHGLGQNSHSLMSLYSEIISKTKFSVFAPEYRGFGKNIPAKLSEENFFEDAQRSLDYLINEKKIKPENITVLGHSFGGFVASNLASKYPNLERLILVSSVDNFESEILNSTAVKHVSPAALFILKHVKIVRNYLKKLFNTTSYLSKTAIPVNLIHAQDDKVVGVKASEDLSKICQKLEGLHILPRGGHSMESNKIDTIVSLLNKF